MKKVHAVLLPPRVPALVPLTIQLPKETTYSATVLKDVVTPHTHISEASKYILYTIILTIDGICTLS